MRRLFLRLNLVKNLKMTKLKFIMVKIRKTSTAVEVYLFMR